MATCPTTGWSTIGSDLAHYQCATNASTSCAAAFTGQQSTLSKCYDTRIAESMIAAKEVIGYIQVTLDERGDRFQFGNAFTPYPQAKACCAQRATQIYRTSASEGPICSWDESAFRTTDRFCVEEGPGGDCLEKEHLLEDDPVKAQRFMECVRGTDYQILQAQGGCWMNSAELWTQIFRCYEAASPGLINCMTWSFQTMCNSLTDPESTSDILYGKQYLAEDGTVCPSDDLLAGMCVATQRLTPALTLTWADYGNWVGGVLEYIKFYSAAPDTITVKSLEYDASAPDPNPVSVRIESGAADPIADLNAIASYVTRDPYIATTAGSYPRVDMYVPAEPEQTAAPGDISTGIMVPVTVGLLVLAIFIPKLLGQRFDFRVVRYATSVAFAIATVALASSRWAGEPKGLYKAAGITAECMCSNPESMCPVDKHDLARAGQVFYVFASISLTVAVTVTIVAITGATKPTKLPSFVSPVLNDLLCHPRAAAITAIVSSVIGTMLIGIYGGLVHECPLATSVFVAGIPYEMMWIPTSGGAGSHATGGSMFANAGVLGGSWGIFLVAMTAELVIGTVLLVPPLGLLPAMVGSTEGFPRKLPYLILLLVLLFNQIFFGFIGLAVEDWSSVSPNFLGLDIRANPFHTCICAAPTSDMVKATAAFYIMYYIVTTFTLLAWVVAPAIVVIIKVIHAGAGDTVDKLFKKVADIIQPFQRIVLLVRAIVVCVFLIIALTVFVFLPISKGYEQMALSQGYYLALAGGMLEMACLGWNIFGDHSKRDEGTEEENAGKAADDARETKTVEVRSESDRQDV
jgi:hypothetical protein